MGNIPRHYSKIENQKSDMWFHYISHNIYDKMRTKRLTDEEFNKFDRLVKIKQERVNFKEGN